MSPVEASEAPAAADPNDLRTRLTRLLLGQSFLAGVLRSFFTLAAGEWVARLIGVVIQVWLARQLTPGPYGVITFGIALIGWFGLVVDSGTEQLNVREIARHPERFRDIADRVLALRLALSIAAGIVLAVFTYEFSRSASARDVLPRFALVLPALAINLRWMVLGINQARAVAYGNVASRIVFLGAIVLLVTSPNDTRIVPILEALSEATYAVVIIVFVSKAYGYVRPKIDLGAWKKTLTEGFPLLVYGACRATINTVDIVMIALILGHSDAGLFGVAIKPATFFIGAIGLFSIALISGYSAAPESETDFLFRRSVLLGSLSMTAVAIVITVATPLVTFVFGHDYSGSGTAMAVVAWTLPIAGLSAPYGSVLVARRRQDLLMRNNVVATVVYLAANAVVITFAGIVAAAGVRVGTYAIVLLLNQRVCVSRGLAPSLSSVFAGRWPRLVPGRGRA